MPKLFILLTIVFFTACKGSKNVPEEEVAEPRTPVTVATISNVQLAQYLELNATSAFLQKWIVRSNATGYLHTANATLNKYVNSKQILFTVKTKEAQSIGNSINILDKSFKFSGVNNIAANVSGFISQVDHQSGDYVLDGDQLAVITDTKSFVFLMDMPYELKPFVINKKQLQMMLPDGELLMASVSGTLPSMDPASQTQRIILKVNSRHSLPENLIAKVRIVKSLSASGNSLPKSAVLTNETQTEFWIMKMLNDSVAAKVPVKKGIETQERIEILSPVLYPTDKVLITGNYGLNDTAKVQIVKE